MTAPASLRIEPGGWCVPLAPGQSLLEAALRAGIRLPSSCRNGTCRACMCRLREGSVHYRIEWPGLLAEEKAEGLILPCVALATEPVVIDAPAAFRESGG
ncbi:2Fe-2S iron-sulfur cluster binding domain-containing protein [Ideonella sp. A 288]|uniref:2Fe-2S iron-sulfur cluster-binding protein n=1 Tax=Ideonella sp. A 288 TaxID=1962181 RepID=UPI000B4AC40F|nr:2Fe-2S iron-sulfur cluster binding domain-containing protein [Ideonella sp. A 288]